MQYQPSFTFIIGYRHKQDRLNNLKRTIDWVNGFSNVQLILVEQDKHSKISQLNLKCEHIFVKSNMPYNRSWSFNVGLKYAKSQIVVFGDSDLIMNPEDFINGLKSMSEYEMVSPYTSVVDLTPQETGLPFEQITKITRPGRGENDNQKINISGGISIFRKESIMKIGGWSEDFIGWGGEDDFQTIKVHQFLKWTELSAKCYHLFHNREPLDQKNYQKTLQILQKAKTLNKEELLRSISMSSSKMGMKNKYDTF
jgi:predicted glycosyltransferase involved in capsule biosynthesis